MNSVVAPSAVLFDFDHTLFTHDDSPGWVRDACHRIGRQPGEAAARSLYDRMRAAHRDPGVVTAMRGCQRSTAAHRQAHLDWFEHAGVDPDLATALYERLCSPSAWTPYTDTGPTLAAMRERGTPVAVVSNVGWDLRPTFAAHGLDRYVDTFVLSCEEGSEKPEPGLFRTACARLGVEPSRALMVGDDPVNDGAAVTEGLHVRLLPDRPPGRCRGLATALHCVIDPHCAPIEGDFHAPHARR